MTPSAVVPANVEGTRYDITIRRGLLADVGTHLSQLSKSKKAAVVTDSNVGPAYAERLRASLAAAGIELAIATIPAGEDHKTLSQISPVYDAFLAAKIERTTPVLALGGGMIGDMAGFVAATLLRGVPFVQIPTTLLAMVDASVGGKTGINHPTGKNLIGAFHQPIAVLVDPDVLQTLPERELHGGLAECIKHEIIRDSIGFAALERDIARAAARDIDYLATLVAHNVAIKAKVVEADPYEKAERAHLNFGHTFGHAIETISHYSYSHGECVALGMVAAARMATDLGMLDDVSRRRIVALAEKAGLPVSGLKLPTKAIVDAMIFDKKVKGGKVRFVLPDRIGHVVVRDDVPEEMVSRAVESLRLAEPHES
ncbi:MAG TPA: 3-dehydroquinate synthase [Tepidisphaeraceae bacterium]|jgi:3-dehydroquinate synthase|nr:3-dehydroquinate synthase [Tepidisphaeraceae bacterium]